MAHVPRRRIRMSIICRCASNIICIHSIIDIDYWFIANCNSINIYSCIFIRIYKLEYRRENMNLNIITYALLILSDEQKSSWADIRDDSN